MRRILKISVAALLITVTFVSGVAVPFASAKAAAANRYEVLLIGDEDEYVFQLQKELYAKGFLKKTPTGYFGSYTQKAVMDFQKENGLTQDGKAGPETRKLLFKKKYIPLPSTRKVTSNFDMENLGKGDVGPMVRELQVRLKELGYYDYSYITEYYGPKTIEAVMKFQQKNNLQVDGVVGTETRECLFGKKALSAAASAASNTKNKNGNSESKTEKMVDFACKQLGKLYRWGGKGPYSFDNAGFAAYVLHYMNIFVPSSANTQSNQSAWDKVGRNSLKRGDLVFFNTKEDNGKIELVGIYLGKGKFLQASASNKSVIISSMSVGYYYEKFAWGRRIFC